MALTRCPECRKKVSESAETCPHCGYSLNKPGTIIEEKEIIRISPNPLRLYLLVGFLIIDLAFLWWFFKPILAPYIGQFFDWIFITIVIIVIIATLNQIYQIKTIFLILTNKRITGKYKSGLFTSVDIDYPLSAVKKITTTNIFGIGTITIKFHEGFLSTSWIKFIGMKDVKEFKNKFFSISRWKIYD